MIFRNKLALAKGCKIRYILIAIASIPLMLSAALAQTVYIRVNQVGYLADESKIAVVFSKTELNGDLEVIDDQDGSVRLTAAPNKMPASPWGGAFPYYYKVDFSAVRATGKYFVRIAGTNERSQIFTVGPYPAYQDDLLFFMRQQRCGYNPYLDMVCHQRDGRSFYAPFADGTFVDATGGWHDAGDQLKYLITASNATARMILAYELEKSKFADEVDDLGRAVPNGIPDVLDEAKWGLDWIFKLHPAPDQLYHQVADDRDHRGFKLPDQDNADYGWGPNSYRPVYFADGKPQGLGQYKSRSTGIANIAGRSAAAMAMASRVWKTDLRDTAFSAKCLKAAKELYEMGKRQEGFQQGNSFGAPYRYNEITWADDMEWAAAELFKATQKAAYLTEAIHYARLAGTASWMEYEQIEMSPDKHEHYEQYPFTNVGHFALYPLVDRRMRSELAGYYRSGIERIVARGKGNAYGVGVPFFWCSNNLVVAFITQVMLYERMTGDTHFHTAMLAHRDWLFGRNPWGTSMFSGIPVGGTSPNDVHLPTVQILKKPVRGGLVDGPIAASTYKGLIGLTLTHPDPFAGFQPDSIVYHDDVGDYATNEPTMDGTADSILMMAALSGNPLAKPKASTDRFTHDQGAITRGDKNRRKLALVFTGDKFGEGADTIIKTLEMRGVKASFFLTGRFYRDPEFSAAIARLKKDGNYLGPHSDAHLLYADWNDRSKLLVTNNEFASDLDANYAAIKMFGIEKNDAAYFLPPYEWHNQTIAEWTKEFGLKLVNFTPGTHSNADYTTPDDKGYATSESILAKIKEYEAKDPVGLNGFILLTHVGAGPKRTDKFYDHLDELIVWLRSKNYEMVRIDDLLGPR
ncbi:MAG: glycoside hydrolase family 9 protein [Acidobacteriota bacterium]